MYELNFSQNLRWPFLVGRQTSEEHLTFPLEMVQFSTVTILQILWHYFHSWNPHNIFSEDLKIEKCVNGQ